MIREVAFSSSETALIKAKVSEVKQLLLNNLAKFPGAPVPLVAGLNYNGIRLEHNHDNLFPADYVPESAWTGQQIFMQISGRSKDKYEDFLKRELHICRINCVLHTRVVAFYSAEKRGNDSRCLLRAD